MLKYNTGYKRSVNELQRNNNYRCHRWDEMFYLEPRAGRPFHSKYELFVRLQPLVSAYQDPLVAIIDNYPPAFVQLWAIRGRVGDVKLICA